VKIVRLNEDGQLRVPKKMRNELNIKPDTKLCIYVEENKIIIEPLHEDPISVLVELLRGEQGKDDKN